MTNREMLFKIQSVESLIRHIKKRAKVIINNTFDDTIQTVVDIKVSDTYVEIFYDYYSSIYDDYGKYNVKIPIEWFDEGFDYKSAYKELYPNYKERW